jgi:alkylation response protein AidB-like acyl-CoA dehydrogenase
MRFGSQEQKDFFLPKILAGEIHFAIGYTEPDAGTDLASLKTRAVRDGDEYVINGQKVFTSLASDADFIWLAVRTNPDVKKHKGISIIIVPTDTPGFKCEPIRNMAGLNTNITFWTRAAGNLVEENGGGSSQPAQPRRVALRVGGSGRLGSAWAGDRARRPRVIDRDWVQDWPGLRPLEYLPSPTKI